MTIENASYKDFFRLAFFGKDAKETDRPFDYQERLADEILPELLNVPTGAGKTAAILGAWLWRRMRNPESVGRRLIYCLPMRTLVEQTREVAETALDNLRKAELIKPNDFSVHTLYGGDVSDDWDIFPEREQIIIGTQDLLLSRALNRGYAMNRFRWAFHFGLFNNDCLWVFDEVQLFGDGLATTTQLQAFRENQEKFGIFGKVKSIWMSATLDKNWLKTVDFREKVDGLNSVSLSETDRQSEVLKKRLSAVKILQKAGIECRLPKGLAEFVVKKHERGTQTLVVVNTVARAQEVFAEIEKSYAEAEKQAKRLEEPTLFENHTGKPEIKLLHSRFRPAERRQWQKIFNKQFDENGKEKPINRIIVATQVVEAGVDISSKLLITDLAPFSSLVQRFGRCNRNGDDGNAEVFWVDLPLKEKDKDKDFAKQDFEKIDEKKLADILKPYEIESLKKAKNLLENLESVSLTLLEEVLQNPENREKLIPNHVLRQRDLVDLFDTTADLSGFDLDVSRFVRGGEERDVSIYWRKNVEAIIKDTKDTKKAQRELKKKLEPNRDELCSVPIYEAKDFFKNKMAWSFDALKGSWEKTGANNLRTGMILLVETKSGGYETSTGWKPKDKKEVEIVPDKSKKIEIDLVNESYDDDNLTTQPSKFIRYTQTLQAHSRETRQAAERILGQLNLNELSVYSEQIISAAHHHDLGKAHEVFQKTLHGDEENFTEVLAKSKKGGKHSRKKFRHELASALALLENGKSDLEIYLAAAHHGKVRLSIRALPDENKPKDDEGNPQTERKFARGIWDDDKLPETNLGDGVIFPETILNLDSLTLGKTGDEPSWLERMINLRDDLGVFRLAYLEAIVRAADVQASANPIEVLPEADSSTNKQNSLEINENDK
jgi:CRISPR-associated endonuclease/helicase Cas3